MADPKFTAGEKARLAVLIARGAKQSCAPGASLRRIEEAIDRIIDGARKREAEAKK